MQAENREDYLLLRGMIVETAVRKFRLSVSLFEEE
jgi:hypothetical protein